MVVTVVTVSTAQMEPVERTVPTELLVLKALLVVTVFALVSGTVATILLPIALLGVGATVTRPGQLGHRALRDLTELKGLTASKVLRDLTELKALLVLMVIKVLLGLTELRVQRETRAWLAIKALLVPTEALVQQFPTNTLPIGTLASLACPT